MNNKMKVFTRLDGQGRRIAGSSVLRLKKPLTGTWIEDGYQDVCCAPSISVTGTPADTYVSAIVLSVLCDDVEVLAITSSGSSTTIDEMVDALNANFSYLGVFTTDGSDIFLALKLEIATALCDGTLTLDVTGTPTTTTTTL